MARYLIRQAHGGETRTIRDGGLAYFLNLGWVVLDTLDDESDSPPLYLSKAEGDLRWAKISDLSNPESTEIALISEALTDSPGLRAISVAAIEDADEVAPTGAWDFAQAPTVAGAPIAGGGGITDHGALTGLADDDHPQYLNQTRGDARYVQGTDGRLTDARTPTDGSVTNAKVAPGAAIALSKLATDPLARVNHTGTQPAASISDLTEAAQDAVAAFLVAGVGVTVSHDDVANTFTINATGGGGTTDPEIVRDVIGTALVASSGIQITVNDAGDSITIASTAVLPTRQVIAGTGLSGGGDLSADRTLAVTYGTTASTAAQGNDSRLSDARTPLAHTHPASAISDSTTVGRSVLTAADAADARSAIGAGTSNLAIGTTSATAKAGDYSPPAATDGATAGTVVRTSKVTGDTTNRHERRADGTVSIGPGGTTPLRTDGFISLDMGAEPTREGIWVRASSYPDMQSQPLLIVDANEAPIFGVGKAGGASVFGDNFSIFDGGDIFNPEIKLRHDGTVQARRGDPAGGSGVFALGNVTTAPTAQPDGSHTVDGSNTVPGVVFYAKAGRAFVVDGGGVSQEITGGSANVRSITVQKDIGLATLSSIGVPAAAVSGTGTGNTSTSSDNQFVAPFLALTTAATANNAQGVTPSTYSQVLPPFRPMMWTKIRTGSAITSTRYWVGMFSANPGAVASPTALHCAAFRYDTSVDGTAFWRCVTSAASATPTVTTTSVAAAVDTTYNMRIEINASNNSVRFLIDDVVVATHTATLPTAAMAPDVRVTTLSAAARTLHFSRYTVTQLG